MKNWQRKLMRNATNLILQTLVTKMVFKLFDDNRDVNSRKHGRNRRSSRKKL